MKKCKFEQRIPISLEAAWAFFSNPMNLNEITPSGMSFEVKSSLPKNIYPGLIIVYSIRPILQIPMQWVTEITHVKEEQYFVDEQRKGPYRIWHHEHHFEKVSGGIKMTDIIHYDIGMSFLGKIAAALFVDKQVQKIFEYRYEVLAQKFGEFGESHKFN